MVTNKIIETRAIILSEMSYKESSKILTLFSEELGKISVLAKGVMSVKSPNISICQTFTHARYFLREGKSFYYLNRGLLIDSNLYLRRDFEKIIFASLAVEIVNTTTIPGSKNIKIYGLLSKYFRFLKEAKSGKGFFCGFIIKYISFLGYRPIIPKEYVYPLTFLSSSGGIVPGSSLDYGGVEIEEEELKFFNQLLYTSLEDLIKIEFRGNIEKIFSLLIQYTQVNLEINKLNSLQLLL